MAGAEGERLLRGEAGPGRDLLATCNQNYVSDLMSQLLFV